MVYLNSHVQSHCCLSLSVVLFELYSYPAWSKRYLFYPTIICARPPWHLCGSPEQHPDTQITASPSHAFVSLPRTSYSRFELPQSAFEPFSRPTSRCNHVYRRRDELLLPFGQGPTRPPERQRRGDEWPHDIRRAARRWQQVQDHRLSRRQ